MLIEGFGLTGASEDGESAGMPVSGSAICAIRVVWVSTVGTVRRHKPTKPRPMIPAINPIALRRRRVARPTLKEGSDRICPGCGGLDCVPEFAPGCLVSHRAVRPDAVPTRPGS